MKQELAKPGIAKAIRALHEDEDGMESMQVVIIVAIAALVLFFLHKAGWTDVIKPYVAKALGQVTGMTFE
jgi:hypothetical protein